MNENGYFEADVSGSSPALVDVSGNSPVPVDISVDMDYTAIYDAVYSASYDAIEAYSQTVTDGQSINSTALSYFQGILGNQFWPVDYVIYVGSPYYYGNQTYYEYCMAYGDLSVDGTHFTGQDATVVTIRNSTYNRSVQYAYGQDISLDAPMYYSRSNLGGYSGAFVYDWTNLFLLLSVLSGGLVWFIKKLLRLSH